MILFYDSKTKKVTGLAGVEPRPTFESMVDGIYLPEEPPEGVSYCIVRDYDIMDAVWHHVKEGREFNVLLSEDGVLKGVEPRETTEEE